MTWPVGDVSYDMTVGDVSYDYALMVGDVSYDRWINTWHDQRYISQLSYSLPVSFPSPHNQEIQAPKTPRDRTTNKTKHG